MLSVHHFSMVIVIPRATYVTFHSHLLVMLKAEFVIVQTQNCPRSESKEFQSIRWTFPVLWDMDYSKAIYMYPLDLLSSYHLVL